MAKALKIDHQGSSTNGSKRLVLTRGIVLLNAVCFRLDKRPTPTYLEKVRLCNDIYVVENTNGNEWGFENRKKCAFVHGNKHVFLDDNKRPFAHDNKLALTHGNKCAFACGNECALFCH